MAIGNDLTTLPRLFDNLGDLLKKTGGECVPLEKRLRFEREVAADISRFVVRLSEAAEAHCNGSWQAIERDWQQLRAEAAALERTVRIRELENPSSEEDFRANLFWMNERGTEDDLKLLQRLKTNSAYSSEELLQLLDMAIQRIRERTNQSDDSSTIVQRQGEEAYQIHQDEWERRYAGQYIAIYQGAVVASDADKTKLTGKILKQQRETGTFRAYVMQVESPQPVEGEIVENPQLIEEEIRDLKSYLAGIPSDLRSSGAFTAYESRLKRWQQRLSRQQNSGDVEDIGSDLNADPRH
jgi:hypothetical protein